MMKTSKPFLEQLPWPYDMEPKSQQVEDKKSAVSKILANVSHVIVIYLLVSIGYSHYNAYKNSKTFHGKTVNLSPNAALRPDLAAPAPRIVVFWATWCAPCTFELARLKSAVEDQEIDGRHIAAISIDEKLSDVTSVFKERQYPFAVHWDPKLAQHLRVNLTPTVLFLDEQKVVVSARAGIQPFLIGNIQDHLQGTALFNQ
jgi:thiol-disulfide isomerase/thioredoxin